MRRSLAALGLGLLLAAASLVSGGAAEAKSAACAAPSDRGYADGLAGRKMASKALRACPRAGKAYRSAYRAGAYVRRVQGGKQGTARSPIKPAKGPTGASDGNFERRQALDEGTQRTLRRSRCGYGSTQAAGSAGASFPPGCESYPDARRGYDRGQALRRAQSQAAQSAMQRSRLNTRLLSPNLPAAEKRMIQNQLRMLNQQDGLRRMQDPYLR